MIPGGSPEQVILCLVGWMSCTLAGKRCNQAEFQPRHHDFEGGPQQILGISCFKAHSPDLTPLLRCVTLPHPLPSPRNLADPMWQSGKAKKKCTLSIDNHPKWSFGVVFYGSIGVPHGLLHRLPHCRWMTAGEVPHSHIIHRSHR